MEDVEVDMNRKRDGFTLIELMVVVVIIGILGVIALQTFVGRGEKARLEATKAILSKVSNQVDLFKLDHGKYPSKLEDLIRQPSYVDSKNWPPDGYLKKEDEINDAWNNPLLYRLPGSGGSPYDLVSYCADGKEGGENYDKDLWNHDRGGR